MGELGAAWALVPCRGQSLLMDEQWAGDVRWSLGATGGAGCLLTWLLGTEWGCRASWRIAGAVKSKLEKVTVPCFSSCHWRGRRGAGDSRGRWDVVPIPGMEQHHAGGHVLPRTPLVFQPPLGSEL